jgi:cell division septation protein DedD
MPSTSMRKALGLACLVALAAGGRARAADELIPGKRIGLSSKVKVVKMRALPPAGTTFDLPATPPTVSGVTVSIVDTGGGSPPTNLTLQASQWRGLGIPEGSRGYAYRGAGDASDPCKGALIRPKVISFTCVGAAITGDPPFSGDAAVTITVGGTRYCARFGGTTVDNSDTLLRRKDAPPPASCFGGPGTTSTTLQPTTTSTTAPTPTTSTSSTSSTTVATPTTSSTTSPTPTTSSSSTSSTTSTTAPTPTTSSSSTSTSSTTSTTAAACCNGAGALRFTNANLPGDCGDIINSTGTVVANVACAGLYTGGGGNSVPLPYAVPDLAKSITTITSCTGQTATLGGTTSVQTGSNRTCTSAGCLFGGPLAVPNPGSTPTSVCVLNAVGGPPSGTAVCNTGTTSLVLPLSSVLYLTGDTATDPGGTIPGIQPCPLCSGTTCVGGPNNGMACTPGTSALNPAYPTSHDCPPDPMFNIGTLPVNFSLSTGTLTWSGTTATNDTGGTFSVQSRVFSGFCRDVGGTGGTGAFQGSTPATAKLCWENGMAIGTACTEPFESCEQRNNGAFGPSGGANRTIRAIGNGMSILAGAAPATLVSLFSIAPTFDATVDAAGDLPGPGAVALPGTASLCATPNPCP